MAAVLCALLVLGLLAWRPAPILGVRGEALAHSVLGVSLTPPCDELPGGTWKCSLYLGLYDEAPHAVYRVEVNRLGCWHATLVVGSRSYGSDRQGCLTIDDYALS